MLMFIIANALLFAHVLTTERVPQTITEAFLSAGLEPWSFLIVVNLLLLLGSQFMEPSGLLLIVAPVVFPIAIALGVDPRSEEHTSALQSLMRISYAVFCLKKKTTAI